MSERWPLLPEFIGLAAGILIVVSLATGVIFLAQSLEASGQSLIAIASVVFLLTGDAHLAPTTSTVSCSLTPIAFTALSR